MKKLLTILTIQSLLSCGYTRYAPEAQRKVTVQYILRNDDGSGEVWAKYQSPYKSTLRLYYMALFRVVPDSLKPGKVLYLRRNDVGGIDSCQCVQFKLMNH